LSVFIELLLGSVRCYDFINISSVLSVAKHFILIDQLYKISGEHYGQTTQSIQYFSLSVSHHVVSKFQPHNNTF